MNSVVGTGEKSSLYGKPSPVNDVYILVLERGTKIK